MTDSRYENVEQGLRLAETYTSQGDAHFNEGELEAAREDDSRAIEIWEALRAVLEPQGQWTTEMRDDLAAAYLNRGTALYALGRGPEALAAYDQALAIQDALPSGVLPELDVNRFRVYVNAAALLAQHPDPQAFAQDKSRRMADLLELTLPGADDWDYRRTLRCQFADFHARWLGHCIASGATQRIPEILAVIQGRNLAAEVLDRLERPDTPEAVREFQRLRLALRRLNARIQRVIQGGRLGRDGTAGGEPGDSDHRGQGISEANSATAVASPTAYANLLRQHEALLRQARAQRDLAAQERGYEYLNPARRVTHGRLQEALAPNKALLLAVDREAADPGLLLLRRDRPPRWLAVPGLGEQAEAVHRVSDQLGKGRGYRRGPGPAASETETPAISALDLSYFWQELTDWQTQQVWGRLAEDLADLSRLIYLPHGRLHLLPLEAGAPEHLALCRFPGLMLFAERRRLFGEAPPPIPAELALALEVHPGDDAIGHIGHVLTEAEALVRLYPPDAVAYPSGFPSASRPARLVHPACHGGDDPRRPGAAVLHVGPGESLDQDALLDAPGPLGDSFFFNACLAARTVEDLAGTPSGLISSLFRRGASLVVGALVSIPDYWATLLALLTHQACIRGVPLDAALREGKHRLETGDWFSDTEAYLLPPLQVYEAELARRTLDTCLRRLPGWVVPGQRRKVQHWLQGQDTRERISRDLAAVLEPLEGWPATARADLGARIAALEDSDWLTALAEALGEAGARRRLTQRIPPQPELGTLLYGIVTFGEISAGWDRQG